MKGEAQQERLSFRSVSVNDAGVVADIAADAFGSSDTRLSESDGATEPGSGGLAPLSSVTDAAAPYLRLASNGPEIRPPAPNTPPRSPGNTASTTNVSVNGVEASLEGLRSTVEEAMERVKVVRSRAPEGGSSPTEAPDVAWARARLDATVRAMHRLALEHEPLLRTIQRITAGGPTSPGIKPRGSRRVDWVNAAVEPVRIRLGPRRFSRLVSALCTCVGFDSLFLLRDIRGLSTKEAERVTR